MGQRTVATAPTEALTSEELAPGALFAERYEVRAMLGQGGMGAVHRVLDRELGEEIALKVLKPEIAVVEGALERFRREVKLARRVTHTNVARTYDLGAFGGVRYLTMELIDGAPLSHRVRDGRLPLGEALRVASEIARGLAAAHAAGVVHRDLKPDNVMLAGQRVAITDFGIARLAEGRDQPNRTFGVALGTPAYMAPEQVEGRELDGRADVYALGIVLHELLTGRLPFAGDTPWALAAARLEDRTIDPRACEPNVPANVAELVIAALARRRELRLDAAQFVARLDAIRGQVVEPEFVTPARGGGRSLATPTVRTVGLSPLAGHEALARDITTATATALAKVKGVQVLLGEKGDLTLLGSARVFGSRVRVGVSLVDSATGAQVWAEDFAGTLEDPFALEDAVTAGVIAAVQSRASRDTGPNDTIRTTLTRARELMRWYTHDNVNRAIELLRTAHAETPDDPHIMSLLGAALVRAWRNSGGSAPAILAEAEEMTLRALAVDPSNGETFLTIGALRASKSELRAAVRAFEEAATRAPRLAEPHAWLGRLLFESGRVEEAERRIEHALKLDPESVQARGERIRIWGLTGRQVEAMALLEEMPASGGAYLRSRLAFWHRAPEFAARTADLILANPESSGDLAIRVFVPILRGIASGSVPEAPARELAQRLGRARGAAPMNAVVLDVLLVAGLHDEALGLLEESASELLDLGWLDRSPLHGAIRDDARFGAARAAMAGRAAELWK